MPADLKSLAEQLDRARWHNIGFPGATDIRFPDLADLVTGHLLNNVGDPYTEGLGTNHTKDAEREVIDTIAALLRAPAQRWGYITSGSTEGTLAALLEARTRYPHAVAYHSSASHYSVTKAIRILAMRSIEIRASDKGEIDYRDLAAQVAAHRDRPVIVVANIGTTMTEAVDDLRQITTVLDQENVARRFIHADAALAGIPLALLPVDARPGFDFADGADTIVVSGHKFLGVPMPCGILIARRDRQPLSPPDPVAYTGATDTTITGSRNGHTPLYLAHVLRTLGIDGLRHRAEESRALAAYAEQRLTDLGWNAWRHPHALTVVLKTPPDQVTRKWALASTNGWCHLITMPGVARAQVTELIQDLEASLIDTPSVPRPRRGSAVVRALIGG